MQQQKSWIWADYRMLWTRVGGLPWDAENTDNIIVMVRQFRSTREELEDGRSDENKGGIVTTAKTVYCV